MKNMLLIAMLFVSGCNPSDEDSNNIRSEDTIGSSGSSDETTEFLRKSKPPEMKLVPTENSACTFEERSPIDRPDGLEHSNYNSNIVFYHKPGKMGWDHSSGYTREAYVKNGTTIIAARKDMPDLWIRANSNNTVLYSGPELLQCVDYSEMNSAR